MNKIFITSVLFNRQPYTKLFIESLLNNTDEPFDLLLWDNGSGTPTQILLDKIEKLKFNNGTQITIIRNPINEGIGTAISKIQKFRKREQHFMKIDNDILVPENINWLTELIEIIESKENNISCVGYPQHIEQSFYEMFSPRKIFANNKEYIIYDSPSVLGTCFIGHANIYNEFNYVPCEKKYGEGDDMQLHTYVVNKGIKCAYIRPEKMIICLDNNATLFNLYSENREYIEWKAKMVQQFNKNVNSFTPSELAHDNTELNIRQNILI